MNTQLLMMMNFILTLITISSPLIFPPTNFPSSATTAVKTAFFISTPPLMFFIHQNTETITITWSWLLLTSVNINPTIQLDLYSIMFIPIALFVTWNILEFSTWYMGNDPKANLFFKYLLIFLLAMIILVSAGNILVLFIGWEGVGIMSFLLIGWYHGRSNANTAALQAMLYNRIGDIGFLFATCWLLVNTSSLNLHHLLSMTTPTHLLIAVIMAAASKSAQFSLHPWLASAMEGPTPVSALLHSSTMVVAGIFLLIRISPLLQNNQTALTTCLCLGATSTMFAATCAITQNDIKKIIAYSTSSQLGLMMVAIGLNLPHLAFFHISTHAFFKAMLFLCSGSIIHNLNNEQDIRKMGGLQNTLPITTSCISIGSLALMGTPFLAGFYSKDAIIETMNMSTANALAVSLTIIATSFTAIYSLRLIFYASLRHPRTNAMIIANENTPQITNPLKRLVFGSIIAGFIIHQLILPQTPMTHTMPTHLKISALLVTALAFVIAMDLATTSWSNPPTHHAPSKTMNTSFYSSTIHPCSSSVFMNFGQIIMNHLLDMTWLEKAGPKGLINLQLPPMKTIQSAHTGMIKTYLSTLTITLFLSMVISQLA
uniref:NADH-ubiquinone oxidoreductase chain 5 n=1 Tax=Breviceps adspersus TaxID=1283716 RepID=W0TL67_9NEOB|nr:NADH dehydrogenase subunit 5 [Breviceps adspersus]BAO42894.1 NADH dehydrogenase subunit 5 [Breviceps adspersus]